MQQGKIKSVSVPILTRGMNVIWENEIYEYFDSRHDDGNQIARIQILDDQNRKVRKFVPESELRVLFVESPAGQTPIRFFQWKPLIESGLVNTDTMFYFEIMEEGSCTTAEDGANVSYGAEVYLPMGENLIRKINPGRVVFLDQWEILLMESVDISLNSITERAGGSLKEETKDWIIENINNEFKSRMKKHGISEFQIK